MAKIKNLKKPNIVLIITDQQNWNPKYDQGFPKEGENEDPPFPAMTELLEKGIAFNNAYTNATTCTSSRTTLFTGKYPAEHGATQVLAFDDPYNEGTPPKGYTQMMQGELRNNMQNMFKMMKEAGYEVAYKGKWHVSKPTKYVEGKGHGVSPAIDHLYWTAEDATHLEKMYGIKDWNYPDAGDDANVFNFGGGDINNDGRFVDGKGHSAWYGKELPNLDEKKSDLERRITSAEHYIKNYKGEKPLFLVVSLVNPHDVLSYPGNETMSSPYGVPRKPPLYKLGGYRKRHFKNIEVEVPSTWNEKLHTKPKIQTTWQNMLQGFGEINNKEVANNYVKFYAYLTSVVDKEIGKVLETLKGNKHTKDSLIIRISDHGDMAMSHGMMRQKMFSAYQQIINIPMIFSHLSDPEMFSKKTTEAFAGLIDLMPTLAEIAGVKVKKHYGLKGKSLVPILDPNNEQEEVQDNIHFTFDDNYITSTSPNEMGACHIRCILHKEKETGVIWKYAVYFDPDYGQEMEYEMYNLTHDSEEKHNLAFRDLEEIIDNYNRGGKVMKIIKAKIMNKRQELHELLTEVMIEKGTLPTAIIWPKVSGGEVLGKKLVIRPPESNC